MSSDVSIRQGATFERTFTDTDLSASTLTLTISKDGDIVAQETVVYQPVDGEMAATVSIDATMPIGDYKYMWTIVYTDPHFVAKIPDIDKCSGECELPNFKVCISNDEDESS